jgi:hypothetical protein
MFATSWYIFNMILARCDKIRGSRYITFPLFRHRNMFIIFLYSILFVRLFQLEGVNIYGSNRIRWVCVFACMIYEIFWLEWRAHKRKGNFINRKSLFIVFNDVFVAMAISYIIYRGWGLSFRSILSLQAFSFVLFCLLCSKLMRSLN